MASRPIGPRMFTFLLVADYVEENSFSTKVPANILVRSGWFDVSALLIRWWGANLNWSILWSFKILIYKLCSSFKSGPHRFYEVGIGLFRALLTLSLMVFVLKLRAVKRCQCRWVWFRYRTFDVQLNSVGLSFMVDVACEDEVDFIFMCEVVSLKVSVSSSPSRISTSSTPHLWRRQLASIVLYWLAPTLAGSLYD